MDTDLRAVATGGQGRNPEVGHLTGTDGDADTGETPSITQGDVFEVLCNRRRRRVVAYLQECGGKATAGELAEVIAAAEEGIPVDRVSSAERKRVYVSLYQNHLPVMDDASVVDYDADRKTVRLLATHSDLDPYLAAAEPGTERHLSVGVAVVVAVLVLAGGLQLGAFAGTPAGMWPVLGAAGLVGAASLGIYRPG